MQFGELVDHLADLGDVVADRWRGPITILAFGGVARDPAVDLDVTPRSVGEYLRTTGATWRAFLAGVERAITAADPGTVALTLTEDGVAVGPGRLHLT